MVCIKNLALSGLLVGGAAAQASAWAQCGGQGWTGDTTCVGGYRCEKLGDYYSQCTPGTAAEPASSSAPTTAASKTSPTAAAPQTGTGTNPGPTLVAGWYYIRAVAAPNYHSYLQTQPTGLPSPAHLGAAAAAGQFNVVEKQLVYNTGAGGELYLHVENPTDKTQRKLETWFAADKNEHGAFAFQGDTLTWSVADIKRPNEAAWLVCGDGKEVFVNTGAYAYDTPAGCADQTIHYYGGSTPDV